MHFLKFIYFVVGDIFVSFHPKIVCPGGLFCVRHKMRYIRKHFDFRLHAGVSCNTSETVDPVLACNVCPIFYLPLLHLWRAQATEFMGNMQKYTLLENDDAILSNLYEFSSANQQYRLRRYADVFCDACMVDVNSLANYLLGPSNPSCDIPTVSELNLK